MCMFCVALPATAATGIALDRKQRQERQTKGLPPQRVRPFIAVTIFLLMALAFGSAVIHSKFPQLG